MSHGQLIDVSNSVSSITGDNRLCSCESGLGFTRNHKAGPVLD